MAEIVATMASRSLAIRVRSLEREAMTRLEQLSAAVDRYFQGLWACDVALLDDVFHPASSLFDVDQGGGVRVEPYPEWREEVAIRPSPKDAGRSREDQILSIVWLSENAATVAIRVRILDRVFVDHLTLVSEGARFRIVAKTWHLERTARE